MNDEEAKAVQEAAKTADHALNSLDGLGRFVEEAFGYPIREAGGFLGDWIKFKRDNWRKVCERAMAKLGERGVDKLEAIPAKYGVAIIEGASVEDDALLQDMWAGLMANALDPQAPYDPKKLIISVLRELEPHDALVLKLLAQAAVEKAKEGGAYAYVNQGGLRYAQIKQKLDVDESSLWLALLNLQRIGLVTMPHSTAREFRDFAQRLRLHDIDIDIDAVAPDDIPSYDLTALGMRVSSACAII